MSRRKIKVELSEEERKKLQSIVDSPTTPTVARKKIQVLLLTDQGISGPKLTTEEAIAQIGIGRRTANRVRGAYADAEGIKACSNICPKQVKISNDSPKKSKTTTKPKRATYVEGRINLPGFVTDERAKYTVVLTQEEREYLEQKINSGKCSNRAFNRAKILLHVDESDLGPNMTNLEVAQKLNVSKSTIQRVRQLYVTNNSAEEVLNFKHRNAGRKPKITGEVEAHLIATACSETPEGVAKWTLRMLADELIELKVVDSISHTAVGNALKKTNLNHGK